VICAASHMPNDDFPVPSRPAAMDSDPEGILPSSLGSHAQTTGSGSIVSAQVTFARRSATSVSSSSGSSSSRPYPAPMWSAASLPVFALVNAREAALPSRESWTCPAHFWPASSSSTITTTLAPWSGAASTLAQLLAPIGAVVATAPTDSSAWMSFSPSTT